MGKSKLTIAAAVAALALTAVPLVSAKTTVEAKLVAIEKMVDAGKVPEAAQKLNRDYRFDNHDGLQALHGFSVAILRHGLTETDPFERCYAASARGASGDEAGAKILEIAFGSPDPGLKLAAVDGLGDMGNGIAAAALQRLYHSADTYGKRLLVHGLGQVKQPQSMMLLVSATNESDKDTRLVAIEALGRLQDADALPLLRKLLATEQEPYNKVTAAHSLLLLGDNSGLETVLGILYNNQNSDFRASAALALGDARDPRAEAALKKVLTDTDIEVRLAAAGALTHYNDASGLPVIRTAMDSEDSHTRLQAGQLLEHLDFNVGRATILGALVAQDPGLRMAAVHALGTLGGEKEIVFLTESLPKTTDPMMRADVAWALGRIGGTRSIAPLMGLVVETDSAVRYTSADALARTSTRLLDQKSHGAARAGTQPSGSERIAEGPQEIRQ